MTTLPEIFPVLTTNHLDLIEITDLHLNDLFKTFSNEKVLKYYNLLPMEQPKEAQRLIDWFRKSYYEYKSAIRWGITLKDKPDIIGTIGFNTFTVSHRANIGYDLQEAYWNRGYMTEALKAVISFGFNVLKVNRIEAEVMVGNKASVRILQKSGFSFEGILRDWMFWNNHHYDMMMYSILRKDFIK